MEDQPRPIQVYLAPADTDMGVCYPPDPARGGVRGGLARATSRGGRRFSQRRMLQASSAPRIRSGIQSTQSTAQRTRDFPRLVRPWSEFSQVRAIWVGKSAAAGGGGSNFSRSRTLRFRVAREERLSSSRI